MYKEDIRQNNSIDSSYVNKVSKYYNKAAFLYLTSSHEGILQGKILVDELNANNNC